MMDQCRNRCELFPYHNKNEAWQTGWKKLFLWSFHLASNYPFLLTWSIVAAWHQNASLIQNYPGEREPGTWGNWKRIYRETESEENRTKWELKFRERRYEQRDRQKTEQEEGGREGEAIYCIRKESDDKRHRKQAQALASSVPRRWEISE